MQETPNGIFYIALPEPVLVFCKKIQEKTGKSIADVISVAIMEYAKSNGVETHVSGK